MSKQRLLSITQCFAAAYTAGLAGALPPGAVAHQVAATPSGRHDTGV